MARRVARISWRGKGALLKGWSNFKRPWSKFSLLLNQIETDIPAEIGISNDFSGRKQVISKKKRSSPTLGELHKQIIPLCWTKSRQVLHNFGSQILLGGTVFIFWAKIGLKSTKNVRFWTLFRPMGGLEPPRPPGYATVYGPKRGSMTQCSPLSMLLTVHALAEFCDHLKSKLYSGELERGLSATRAGAKRAIQWGSTYSY